MTVTANQVAAALREHLSGVEGGKLHRLLYYIQGHHLALFGRPAFSNTVAAGTHGPEIDNLDDQAVPKSDLGQGVLNVALMVATRYGQLTTRDLARLTQAEQPWRAAQPGQPITHAAMAAFFTADGAQEGADRYTPEHVSELRQEVNRRRARHQGSAEPDSFDDLLAKVAGRARL